ncbi:tyrosyl-tRNA synthetase [Dethiosulfatibacter aminovorans DSM 17477]|uniref:Tyrosine--tRNA ligase n=1 Tax=Dethiosulfatibacter aminovorans DSM 17477 TaxID=1121476 RepID=A0A1M6FBG6_9FIRM|nr:tyrosine--tRNA ligase [Dethiosulfatibacter aminovorans]SHI95088.1 tyrosyl-tRNA synthetase [Dethiosulfatibacter aminovorans DSM 17477]
MERNVFDVLMERGFIEQCTHEEEIRELLGKEKVTFYIGFDPTADSLHIGHYIQIMVMTHMQRHGHKPIAIIGGGTTMIGDPSDRTGMRSLMTKETIAANAEKFKLVFKKFLDFEDDKALMVNNADWLLNLNYVDFLREVGVHFSVNRMLTAECYKNRMEKGLTFLEFNYMIMQAYDFYMLHKLYNCKMQFGGNDQWSNIIAGADLIRRKDSASAYGMTFSLLTTSEGKKMGKTEKGALWLDPEKTSPYDFYQYWRNIDDADVEKCLALLTFLPMEEVRRLGSLEGAEINHAKEVLAFEITKLIHNEEEAVKAQEAARALFSRGTDSDNMPSSDMEASKLDENLTIIDILNLTGLIKTNSEGRRLIQQGGVSVNDEKVADYGQAITAEDFKDGKMIIKKGKKKFHRLNLI